MAGINKPFSKMIRHVDIAEMGLRYRKIKDFMALEVVAEHIQSGKYGTNFKRNHKKKEEDVSLVLQGRSRGPNNNPPIIAQGSNPQQQQLAFNQNNDGRRRFENKRDQEFTHLGDFLKNILALLAAHKKIIELARPVYPKGKRYNSAKRCATIRDLWGTILNIVGY